MPTRQVGEARVTVKSTNIGAEYRTRIPDPNIASSLLPSGSLSAASNKTGALLFADIPGIALPSSPG